MCVCVCVCACVRVRVCVCVCVCMCVHGIFIFVDNTVDCVCYRYGFVTFESQEDAEKIIKNEVCC